MLKLLVLVASACASASCLSLAPVQHALVAPATAWGRAVGVAQHALEAPRVLSSGAPALDELANARIPSADGEELLAYVARPSEAPDGPLPVLILIHEFFGLSQSIADKAQLFADELGCLAIAPDTFRGTATTFIPQAIWLALTTPQPRVNRDLDSVVAWASSQEGADASKLAILGFCYGGGKALRYTTSSSLRGKAATVVFYGNPLTDAAEFANLEAPVCGVFGRNDVQIPSVTVDAFRDALAQAGVANEVVSYDGVGHAFWSDVAQVRRRQMPQLAAWEQTTNFLREFYTSS